MAKENAILEEKEEYSEDSFDFDDLEERLQSQLDLQLSELDFLETEKGKIGNLDNLGEAIKNVVWEQFINQIAVTADEDFIKENNGLKLDLRDESHIQTTENFENGKIATHNTKIYYQKRYDDWQDNFQRDDDGNISVKDKYKTGDYQKVLKEKARKSFDKGRAMGSAAVNKDHTVSAAEIIRDPKANAHLEKQEQIDFANSDKNLKDMDASANKSKGDRKMNDWLDSERSGEKPADRFNINEEELRERDKVAREEYEKLKEEGKKKSIEAGKQSQKEEAFRITGKALRAVIMQLLADLVKEIIAKLVKWFKSAQRNLASLLSSIKDAISSFVGKMKTHLINAGSTVLTTIATSIIGPVVGTIKKVWTLLKQGWKSLKEAVNYIKSPENKGKPIDQLLLETGKIVMAGLSAAGAIVLGEVIEKGLMTIPILAVDIPLIGSLANILGIFMGAVVAGIIGAIAINLIEKAIEKQHKAEIVSEQVDKGNEILVVQREIRHLNEEKLAHNKEQVASTIKERHAEAANYIKESMDSIFDDEVEQNSNQDKFDEMNSLLDELLE
ncbi:AI-2E family transporter [Clostridium sp. SHJSY1]|uniref:cation diffusion facilitator family transporter n=1 Tax=Clostridium sp. SHJSY1 TaxID=2942483 RepID=UPI0028766D04|nr:cation diffusion facilitator family transporter [Clostridium sp. SHJSY1]MDS0526591.1 AI-2E family transporter [Clostridium sp. SHJSY1]